MTPPKCRNGNGWRACCASNAIPNTVVRSLSQIPLAEFTAVRTGCISPRTTRRKRIAESQRSLGSSLSEALPRVSSEAFVRGFAEGKEVFWKGR
jgi:hypothetical protein